MKSWRQSLSEVEKNGFIALPDKGGHSRLICCQNAVSQLRGDNKGFYSKGSKRRAWSARGHSFDWLVVRISGHQHHQPSGSNQPGVYMLVPSIELTSSTWWGFQCLQNSLKILLWVLMRNQEPAPRLNYLFLLTVCLSLIMHPLPSLVNCLNLPLGT